MNSFWTQKGAIFLLNIAMCCCGVLFLLMFFLTLTIFQATSSVHVISMVSRKDSRAFQDLVEISPLSGSTDIMEAGSVRTILEEMLVRYYVEMRYTILGDMYEMARRWGRGGMVHRLSSDKVYNEFRPSDENLNRIMQTGETQTVDITQVRKVKEGLYYVEFDTYTRAGGQVVRRTQNAYLQYVYSSGYRMFAKDFSNPFGLVFVGIDAKAKNRS